MSTINRRVAARAAKQILVHANLAIINSTPKTLPQWPITAKPYLKAIAADDYGLEDPHMVVLYALNNLTSWRGDDARRLKADLNRSINNG